MYRHADHARRFLGALQTLLAPPASGPISSQGPPPVSGQAWTGRRTPRWSRTLQDRVQTNSNLPEKNNNICTVHGNVPRVVSKYGCGDPSDFFYKDAHNVRNFIFLLGQKIWSLYIKVHSFNIPNAPNNFLLMLKNRKYSRHLLKSTLKCFQKMQKQNLVNSSCWNTPDFFLP